MSSKARFWDRFDIHTKRWHTVLALIIAATAVVGLVVKGAVWILGNGTEAASATESTVKVSAGASVARPYQDPNVDPGWGPARPTYTVTEPAVVGALNSIVDNPMYGDERNFTRCKHLDEASSEYSDSVALSGASQIIVYVYLDSATTPGKPEAYVRDTRMKLLLPKGPVGDPGLSVRFSGVDPVTGNEVTVWDGCRVLSDRPVKLSFLSGSGRVNTEATGERSIPDTVVHGSVVIPSAAKGKPAGSFPADGNYGYFTFTVLAVPI